MLTTLAFPPLIRNREISFYRRNMITEEQIKNALTGVKYPGFSRDILSFGLVKDIQITASGVVVAMQLGSGSPEVAKQIHQESERALKAIPGIPPVRVEMRIPAGPQGMATALNPWQNQNRVPGIKRIIAVASGKGGVGKSTTSVNLACALKYLGASVGLLDCDIYGPSIPLMMGVQRKPTVTEDESMMIPPMGHGVKLMSMGFLVEGDAPVIWRGPMIMKTIQQFFTSVAWGDLDYLLIDLPPGTGDAQLSLCQTVPLDGGVIVTTPQEASLGVVRKGIAMFEKVNVKILGLVENMSYFTTPNGERVEIFGHGGGKNEAERQKINFLGEIPLFTEIRQAGDAGIPLVVSAPKSIPAQAFIDIARRLQLTLS